MARDASQDMGQPGAWIDVAQLDRYDECVDGSGALAAPIRVAEQPRLELSRTPADMRVR
jgi:hypothetical protein